LGYLANHEALQSITCNFGESGCRLMAIHGFSLCTVGKVEFFSIAKTCDDTFLKGADLANTCRARGQFIYKKIRKTKGHFAGPIRLSHNLAINREKKKPADIKQRTLENPILSNLTLL
jgi:hypothetical protein